MMTIPSGVYPITARTALELLRQGWRLLLIDPLTGDLADVRVNAVLDELKDYSRDQAVSIQTGGEKSLILCPRPGMNGVKNLLRLDLDGTMKAILGLP